jgi:hypothetical protein
LLRRIFGMDTMTRELMSIVMLDEKNVVEADQFGLSGDSKEVYDIGILRN